MNLFNLKGKRALITGGTHGLGMAMAKGLGLAGAELIINGHSDNKMKLALSEYANDDLKAHGRLFDVTNDQTVKQAIDSIEREIGPIDILVNNAGIIKRIPMVDMATEDFREVINVDLIAPFIVSKYVGKHMIERKAGKIINICSMMSELGRNTVSAMQPQKAD